MFMYTFSIRENNDNDLKMTALSNNKTLTQQSWWEIGN
jgi:hypothetical protein